MNHAMHNFPKSGRRRYRRRASGIKAWVMIVALLFAGGAILYGRIFPESRQANVASSSFASRTGKLTGCQAARALGIAPMRRGDPNYRPELDADGDGVACEPFR